MTSTPAALNARAKSRLNSASWDSIFGVSGQLSSVADASAAVGGSVRVVALFDGWIVNIKRTNESSLTVRVAPSPRLRERSETRSAAPGEGFFVEAWTSSSPGRPTDARPLPPRVVTQGAPTSLYPRLPPPSAAQVARRGGEQDGGGCKRWAWRWRPAGGRRLHVASSVACTMRWCSSSIARAGSAAPRSGGSARSGRRAGRAGASSHGLSQPSTRRGGRRHGPRPSPRWSARGRRDRVPGCARRPENVAVQPRLPVDVAEADGVPQAQRLQLDPRQGQVLQVRGRDRRCLKPRCRFATTSPSEVSAATAPSAAPRLTAKVAHSS